MATVKAICTSPRKGMRKTAIPEGVLQTNYGLVGDGHADRGTHRQVSLLAMESIAKMQALGLEVGPGDFAENLTTEGLDLLALPIGTTLRLGQEIEVEVTQIGKECHSHCAIFEQAGMCVMPTEGIFVRVLLGGVLKTGDQIRLIEGEKGMTRHDDA